MKAKLLAIFIAVILLTACGSKPTLHPTETEMIAVKGGTFMMGDPAGGWDFDIPVHQVTVSDFSIGKYEVTQKQWLLVMGTTVAELFQETIPESAEDQEGWVLRGEGDNYPMYCVSWDDIVGKSGKSTMINGTTYYEDGFIYKLNQLTGKQYRLPTEAEWEFAARGGTKSKGYTFSGSNTLSEVAWADDNSEWNGEDTSEIGTHPVGTKKPNELGIYDMTGNVSEWCSDWFGRYTEEVQQDPKGASYSEYGRIHRGSFYWGNELSSPTVHRSFEPPDYRGTDRGFRLALSSGLNIVGDGPVRPDTDAPDNNEPTINKRGEPEPTTDLVTYDFINDSDLKKYKSYELYEESEYGQLLAFTTKTPVQDFSWLAIQIASNDDWETMYYEIVEELWTTKELLPDIPFVVRWQPVGIMSASCYSYRDTTGKKVYYIMQEGNYGDDPENYDGPAMYVNEFFPQQAVTGRYDYMQEFDSEASMTLYLSENSYKLEVNDRVYNGIATIEFGKFSDGNYTWFVELKGIKWDHDWSDSFLNGIPPDDQWVDKDTYGIYMWLEADELIFQNSGNPMSPYSIFDDIPSKFASLKRER